MAVKNIAWKKLWWLEMWYATCRMVVSDWELLVLWLKVKPRQRGAHLCAPHSILSVLAAKCVVFEVANAQYYNYFTISIKYYDYSDT